MITLPKVISLGLLSIGVFVLMQVLLPIISYQLWALGQNYNSGVLSSPKVPQNNILGVSIQTKDNFPAFVSSLKRDSFAVYPEFNIKISKINLKDTKVYVDSNDLSKGLAHLPGSALPGERGNVFISGHSALNRLWSIDAFFAKLPDMKIGDEIEVDAQGTIFNYQVVEIKTINPTDISVINPPDEVGRYITLMTCVPPGLNFKRLIVVGKMI